MASRITFKTDTENSIVCPNNLLWWTFYPSILKEVNENLSNSTAARLFSTRRLLVFSILLSGSRELRKG